MAWEAMMHAVKDYVVMVIVMMMMVMISVTIIISCVVQREQKPKVAELLFHCYTNLHVDHGWYTTVN